MQDSGSKCKWARKQQEHQETRRRLVTWLLVVNSLLKSLFSLTAKNQSMQLRRKEKSEKMTSQGVGSG